MEFIAHRVNTIKELQKLSPQYGVELDLRDDYEGRIYIAHHPYVRGEYFEDYLKEYRHGTMILNIKSERIEEQVLKLIHRYQVKTYFFLDCSFPMIYFLIQNGERNIALRVSEYEGMDTARRMRGKAEWIWADCFHQIPVNKEELEELKSMGYRVCLVSPELQGREQEIETYKAMIEEQQLCFDAICTKACNIPRWKIQ